MNQHSCITGGFVFCLALVIAGVYPKPLIAQEPQSPLQQTQPQKQYLVDWENSSGPMTVDRANAILGPGCGDTEIADLIAAATKKANERRLYRVPLHHTTTELILAEMESALVPEDGQIVLRRGETMQHPFGIAGVSEIPPLHRDNSFWVLCSAYGYNYTHSLVECLDVPVRQVSPPAVSPTVVKDTHSVPIATEGTSPPRLYDLPLNYITPEFVLKELSQSYQPNSGVHLLKPGEVIRNAFIMEGVKLIIPNRNGNSLLVLTDPYGYDNMKMLIRFMDVPAVRRPDTSLSLDARPSVQAAPKSVIRSQKVTRSNKPIPLKKQPVPKY